MSWCRTACHKPDVWGRPDPEHQKITHRIGEAHQWNLAQFMNNNGSTAAFASRREGSGISTPFGMRWVPPRKKTMDPSMLATIYDRLRASYNASMAASSGWITQSEGCISRPGPRDGLTPLT
jgi:hypothetical protein